MKKLSLLLLLLVAFFASCSEDKPDVVNPKISFTDANFEIPKGCTKQIKVVLEKAVTASTTIPVTFSGTAVDGVDYTVNEASITFAADTKEGIISITVPYEIETSKEIILTLGTLPAGYDAGRFISKKIKTTLATTTIFSFTNSLEKIFANEAPIEVNLKNQDGSVLRVADLTNVAIGVDASSTAVLGVNYKFKEDKKYAEIKKGKANGEVIIELMKWEEGKDKIVLVCGEPNGYFDGTNPTVTITIVPPIAQQIIGEWKGLSAYKLDAFARDYYLSDEQKAKLPTVDASDILNFKDGSLEVNLKGQLKNYFRNCTWAVNGSSVITLSNEVPREKVTAPIIELSKVNYAFSANSEDLQKKSISAFITSNSQYKEILVIYIAVGNDASYNNTDPTEFDFMYGMPLTPYQFIRK